MSDRSHFAAKVFLAMPLVVGMTTDVWGGINCGNEPRPLPVETKEDIKIKGEAGVKAIVKSFRLVDIEGDFEKQKHDIFQKYSNLDKIDIARYYLWTSCQAVLNEGSLDEKEKIDIWRNIYKGLSRDMAPMEGSFHDIYLEGFPKGIVINGGGRNSFDKFEMNGVDVPVELNGTSGNSFKNFRTNSRPSPATDQ